MAASEKLKQIMDERGWPPYDRKVGEHLLAVVETAEAIRYAVEPLMTPPPTPLGDALDALEEALT